MNHVVVLLCEMRWVGFLMFSTFRCRVEKVDSLWRFARQLHRVVGPHHSFLDKAEGSFNLIAKIVVPNRRDYFKRR